MKIFDCFMYFDENLILDLRLNILNKYVDYFVIVESKFTHSGKNKKLNFDIKNFEKFKDKIIYLIHDQEPININDININDDENEKNQKKVMNAVFRENDQRNFLKKGLENANAEDIIIISDIDEIPNLKNIEIENINKKIIFFQQDMFYYKFNLKIPNVIWNGSRACKKKYLKNPQWLRNIKDKKYFPFRPDVLFSDKKYSNIKFIPNGGWHFTNIKSARDIEYKLKSYLHHGEFDINPLTEEQIKKIMNNKTAIYDLKVDQRVQKIGQGSKLEKFAVEKLPEYIKFNVKKFEGWLE
tara:strand:- start:1574 stop:2464 length:891 start_codon:yes stop_codon:yes gene_type:complete